MPLFKNLRRALQAHEPKIQTDPSKRQAAVAAVFHVRDGDPYLLFIERAAHPRDPWSGHIAFPGGTIEPQDADLKATAERETFEELGIDLNGAAYLGRLDDVTGATLPVAVAGFVYAVDDPPRLCPNAEICDAFWTPFAHVIDPARRRILNLTGWEPLRKAPAIDLLGPNRPLLWGLTYRLVAQLTGLAGHALPEM